MKPYTSFLLLFVLASSVLLSRPHMSCAGPNARTPSLSIPTGILAGVDPTPLSELTTASSSSTLLPADSIAADSTTYHTNRIPRFADCQPVHIGYIQMFSEKTGWAISRDNYAVDHVLCTGDGGTSWQDVTPPEKDTGSSGGGKSIRAFFFREDLAWITYYYDPVWHTTDRGQSWISNQPLDTTDISYIFGAGCLYFIDPQTGWLLLWLDSAMGSIAVVLFKTTDGGVNWDRLFHPWNVWTNGKSSMVFIDSSVGMSTISHSAYERPLVTWTNDGGLSWKEEVLPPPESKPDLFERSSCDAIPLLLSPKRAILGVSCHNWIFHHDHYDPTQISPFLYITDDGGISWHTYPYPGGKLIFLNPNVGWAVSNYIFHTQDGGQTWSWIATVGWDGQFSFVNEQVGWAVARWQLSSRSDDSLALMHTTDGGRTWKEMEPRTAGKCPSER